MPFGLMYVHAYSIGSVDINTHIRRPKSSAIHKRRSARGIGLREDCIAQGKSSTRSRPRTSFRLRQGINSNMTILGRGEEFESWSAVDG